MSLLQTIPQLVLAGTESGQLSGTSALVLTPSLTLPLPASMQFASASDYSVTVNGSGVVALTLSGVNNGNVSTITAGNSVASIRFGAYGSGNEPSAWTNLAQPTSPWASNLNAADNVWVSP